MEHEQRRDCDGFGGNDAEPENRRGNKLTPFWKNRWLRICCCALLTWASLLGARAQSVAPADVQRSIQLAAGYLMRHCNERGRFEYRLNLNPAVTVRPSYNMLRHAGSIYALATYARANPDPLVLQTIRQASRYLVKSSVAPVHGPGAMLAVWSCPETLKHGRKANAKLGGAGLALIGLLSAEEVCPGSTPLEMCQALGRFILFMQKPNGGFYSKYIPDGGGRDETWTSLYYPGEAALGLLLLAERDSDPAWRQAAVKGLEYLARIRTGRSRVEADHWALLATARLLNHPDHKIGLEMRHRLLAHGIQICRSILQERTPHASDMDLRGCFVSDGRTCPTATRLEGLQAFLPLIEKNDPQLHQAGREAIDEGIAFLLRSQLKSGPHAGGMPRAVGSGQSAKKRAASRDSEVRIDYVQHALSAMMQINSARGH
jgi:hypothetical protein